MARMKDFADPLLVPVELRSSIVLKQDGVKTTNVFYIISSSGALVTFGIPERWARFMIDKINKGEEKLGKGSVLLRLIIPHDCLYESDGKIVEMDKDGDPVFKTNLLFNRFVASVNHNFRDYTKFRKAKIKMPMYGDLHVIAVIYVTKDNIGTLPKFLAVLERMLFETGILYGTTKKRYIQCFDGSRVVVVDNKEDARIDLTIKEFVE